MERNKNYLKLDGNYAEEILSYYLWGQSTPPTSNQIILSKFDKK